MLKKIFKKNEKKYLIIVKRKNKPIYELHQHFIVEALLDVYWAFNFGEAEEVEILYSKDKKNKKIFYSIEDFKQTWRKYFGNNTNYFVWYDRHVIEG